MFKVFNQAKEIAKENVSVYIKNNEKAQSSHYEKVLDKSNQKVYIIALKKMQAFIFYKKDNANIILYFCIFVHSINILDKIAWMFWLISLILKVS